MFLLHPFLTSLPLTGPSYKAHSEKLLPFKSFNWQKYMARGNEFVNAKIAKIRFLLFVDTSKYGEKKDL
jgi:hypothetical protein